MGKNSSSWLRVARPADDFDMRDALETFFRAIVNR